MSKKAPPKLSVSQNFLTSDATVKRIVRLAGLKKEDRVLEIGPGRGHITKQLLGGCGHVTAIEFDSGLCARLAERFSGVRNLTLRCGDFLDFPLPDTPYKVFANIPFGRTTDIIKKLMYGAKPPTDAWLVMEKGAAKRFLGLPRENLHSLTLKPLYDAEIRYWFRREDLHPAPSVDAVLVRFQKKQVPALTREEWGAYRRFIAAGLPRRSKDTQYVQWLCLFRRSGRK